MPKRNPKGTSGKNLVIAMFVFYADAKGIMVHKHLAMLLITKDLYILIKLLLFNCYCSIIFTSVVILGRLNRHFKCPKV